MKIKLLPEYRDHYYGVMDDHGYVSFTMDRIYDVMKILNSGFLVCHDGYFVVIAFERARRVTKLEEVLT